MGTEFPSLWQKNNKKNNCNRFKVGPIGKYGPIVRDCRNWSEIGGDQKLLQQHISSNFFAPKHCQNNTIIRILGCIEIVVFALEFRQWHQSFFLFEVNLKQQVGFDLNSIWGKLRLLTIYHSSQLVAEKIVDFSLKKKKKLFLRLLYSNN